MKSAQTKKQLFDDLRQTLKARARLSGEEQNANSHPDVSELASFFYGKSKKTATAAHLSICQNCADEIALYAKAEHLAADYKPNKKAAAKIPAAAWQMISNWEDNSFAKPKPKSETVSAEMLAKFARLLSTRKELQAERNIVTKTAIKQVSVIIVNRSGEVRSIEVFEKREDKRGEITLKYAEKSGRFDNKELHALLHQGGKKYDVESFTIERDKVRVGKLVNPDAANRHADYFIIED